MEKSQWDLKKVRLMSRRFSRMDDFVSIYKGSMDALLREYADSLKRKKKQKKHRVETEKWKPKKQRRRGVYVAPRKKAFTFQTSSKKPEPLITPDCPSESRPPSPLCPADVLHLSSPKLVTPASPGESHPPSSDLPNQQLNALWKKRSTEVIVAVLPSQMKGRSLIIHHSELLSLRAHLWLTGEIIHGLMHLSAYNTNVVDTIYLMDHYTAGVILFGDRDIYIHANSGTVFQMDPSPASFELEDSTHAAQRLQEYLKMRTSHGKTDWVDIHWKGGVIPQPVQKDGCSCGVIVVEMARAVMEAFPQSPHIDFDTSKKAINEARRNMGLQVLEASVFDDEMCAMCGADKPPGDAPANTDWIQCDKCDRWFHALCANMDTRTLEEFKKKEWLCVLCR
ncbi:unnamed protein product [Arctogadus glacialis]